MVCIASGNREPQEEYAGISPAWKRYKEINHLKD